MCVSSRPRISDEIVLGLEYIGLAPGFVREVVDVYYEWEGREGCAYEDQGVDDGAPDRSRQTLQAKRPSPGISEAQDQVIQRRETGLKNRFFQGRRYTYPRLLLQVPHNELDNVTTTRSGAPQRSATSTKELVRSDLRTRLV